jgi:hypothetical protein
MSSELGHIQGLGYFLVKWFLFGSQDSTFEPFQEAACAVQKLYTMKND